MAYKNQNYMTNCLIKGEVDKQQKDYVAENEEPVIEEPTKQKYSFISFGDDQGNVKWGEGVVEVTGVQTNGYSEVKVLENTPETSFVNQKFFIISTATPGNTLYQLYTDAGTTFAEIYVQILEYVEQTTEKSEDTQSE